MSLRRFMKNVTEKNQFCVNFDVVVVIADR
jgi:hypothetical protein